MIHPSSRKYILWLPIAVAIALITGLWIGAGLSNSVKHTNHSNKIDQVFDIIAAKYVDPVEIDSLVEMTLPILLENLDPHSTYIARKDREVVNRDLEGSFFGVGISFQMFNDTIYVLEVINGAAAEEAGILPGDKIVEIDGENVAGIGMSSDDVFTRLRGQENTIVDVKVKRHGSKNLIPFTLVRGEVPVSPVDAAYMVNDSIAFLRLGKFSDNTYPETLKALNELRFKGAKAYIIDLRSNGGGYMSPAVLLANEFFDTQNIIVMTKGRSNADASVLFTDRSGAFGKDKIVVLIDEFTASSSEIFSGAIQDNDRGLIIGRRSFGKGLVQTSFELPDSSEFRLTIQRYYTPSGRCIQKTYKPGENLSYQTEVYDRFSNGEIFALDSARLDTTQIFTTLTGRPVYGGGGIIPDIFIPSDTTGMTSYYIKVSNAGLLRKFAYEYADLNRDDLNKASNVNELISMLPSDDIILGAFVNYAAQNGNIPRQWYYINQSKDLIVSNIKALITRDILGLDGYFEVINTTDPIVLEAIHQIKTGGADFPIKPSTTSTSDIP